MFNKSLTLSIPRIRPLAFDVSLLGKDQSVAQDHKAVLETAVSNGAQYLDVSSETSQRLFSECKLVRESLALGIVFDLNEESFQTQVAKALTNLKTTYLDLALANIKDKTPLELILASIVELKKLKSEGKIKAFGVRVETHASLKTILEKTVVDAIQMPFSIFNQTITSLIVFLKTKGIALIAEDPLDGSWLKGRSLKTASNEPLSMERRMSTLERKYVLIEKLKNVTRDPDLTPYAIGFVQSFDAVTVVLSTVESMEELSELEQAAKKVLTYKQKNDLVDFYNLQIKNQPGL
jgi:aryl-alcohol dehydrogenase-like predicted oxidoreductase